MVKKCNVIGLGKLNKNMLIIFLGIAFNAAIFQVGNRSQFFRYTNSHPVVYNLAYSFGLCLAFIIYIRYIVNNRRIRKLKDNNNSSLNFASKELSNVSSLLSTDKKVISETAKILWILLMSFFDFVSRVINCYLWIPPDKYFLNWPFALVVMSISCYFILKMKLYKHHYLSLIIIIVLGLAHNIISKKFNKGNIEIYLNYIITFLTDLVFNVLLLVIYKYLMTKKFVKSFEILFYEGIFESVIGIIILIITKKINIINNFFDYYHSLNTKEIIVFILLIICDFGTYLIKIIVVDLFSSFHAFLITNLAQCVSFLIEICTNQNTSGNTNQNTNKNPNQNSLALTIIPMVFIVIALIMFLVYLEIIELNFCGLSDMTKKNIELRAQLDTLIIENKVDSEQDKISNSSGYELSMKSINSRDSINKDKLLELNTINEEDENKSETAIIDKDK